MIDDVTTLVSTLIPDLMPVITTLLVVGVVAMSLIMITSGGSTGRSLADVYARRERKHDQA